MPVKKLKWNSLLRYAELEFEPQAPKVLEVSDELTQSLSWLTAATQQDRRLVRCTEQGALLVADAWSGLNSVETTELTPTEGTAVYHEATKVHKGVLISTSTELVKISFHLGGDIALQVYYVPPANYFWYPHQVYQVWAEVVPETDGLATEVGVTYFD